jgi:drug/metabolite transporter (DMT)-like permease
MGQKFVKIAGLRLCAAGIDGVLRFRRIFQVHIPHSAVIFIFHNKRVVYAKYLFKAYGSLGVILVSTNLDFASLNEGQLAGDMLLLISGVAWAVFMVYNKKLVMKSTTETFQSMTWVLLFTFISIIPFTFLAGPGFFTLSGWAWLGIFWTAIVCWVIPYYLWLEGLKHLSASVSTVLLLSEIVVAVILSIIVLKEPITVFSTLGAFLIVIAIALVSLQDKKVAGTKTVTLPSA